MNVNTGGADQVRIKELEEEIGGWKAHIEELETRNHNLITNTAVTILEQKDKIEKLQNKQVIVKQELIDEIEAWIVSLNSAERTGSKTDEPEGSRYIKISETLADGLVVILKANLEIVKGCDPVYGD